MYSGFTLAEGLSLTAYSMLPATAGPVLPVGEGPVGTQTGVERGPGEYRQQRPRYAAGLTHGLALREKQPAAASRSAARNDSLMGVPCVERQSRGLTGPA